MSKKIKKVDKLTDEQIMDEIRSMSEAAQQTSSHQLDLVSNVELGDDNIDLGFDRARLAGTADPDKSHRLYYTMRRVMVDNLPKGDANLKLRKIGRAHV